MIQLNDLPNTNLLNKFYVYIRRFDFTFSSYQLNKWIVNYSVNQDIWKLYLVTFKTTRTTTYLISKHFNSVKYCHQMITND